MEPSPSWEDNSCSATKEIHSMLWNPEIHYHVHKSPSLMSILSQKYPVYTLPSYLFVAIIHCLGHPKGPIRGQFFMERVVTSCTIPTLLAHPFVSCLQLLTHIHSHFPYLAAISSIRNLACDMTWWQGILATRLCSVLSNIFNSSSKYRYIKSF